MRPYFFLSFLMLVAASFGFQLSNLRGPYPMYVRDRAAIVLNSIGLLPKALHNRLPANRLPVKTVSNSFPIQSEATKSNSLISNEAVSLRPNNTTSYLPTNAKVNTTCNSTSKMTPTDARAPHLTEYPWEVITTGFRKSSPFPEKIWYSSADKQRSIFSVGRKHSAHPPTHEAFRSKMLGGFSLAAACFERAKLTMYHLIGPPLSKLLYNLSAKATCLYDIYLVLTNICAQLASAIAGFVDRLYQSWNHVSLVLLTILAVLMVQKMVDWYQHGPLQIGADISTLYSFLCSVDWLVTFTQVFDAFLIFALHVFFGGYSSYLRIQAYYEAEWTAVGQSKKEEEERELEAMNAQQIEVALAPIRKERDDALERERQKQKIINDAREAAAEPCGLLSNGVKDISKYTLIVAMGNRLKENAALQTENDSNKSTIQDLTNQLEARDAREQSLKDELSNAHQKIHRATNDNVDATLREKIINLEKKLSEITNSNKAMAQENKRLVQEVDQLNWDNKEQKATIDQQALDLLNCYAGKLEKSCDPANWDQKAVTFLNSWMSRNQNDYHCHGLQDETLCLLDKVHLWNKEIYQLAPIHSPPATSPLASALPPSTGERTMTQISNPNPPILTINTNKLAEKLAREKAENVLKVKGAASGLQTSTNSTTPVGSPTNTFSPPANQRHPAVLSQSSSTATVSPKNFSKPTNNTHTPGLGLFASAGLNTNSTSTGVTIQTGNSASKPTSKTHTPGLSLFASAGLNISSTSTGVSSQTANTASKPTSNTHAPGLGLFASAGLNTNSTSTGVSSQTANTASKPINNTHTSGLGLFASAGINTSSTSAGETDQIDNSALKPIANTFTPSSGFLATAILNANQNFTGVSSQIASNFLQSNNTVHQSGSNNLGQTGLSSGTITSGGMGSNTNPFQQMQQYLKQHPLPGLNSSVQTGANASSGVTAATEQTNNNLLSDDSAMIDSYFVPEDIDVEMSDSQSPSVFAGFRSFVPTNNVTGGVGSGTNGSGHPLNAFSTSLNHSTGASATPQNIGLGTKSFGSSAPSSSSSYQSNSSRTAFDSPTGTSATGVNGARFDSFGSSTATGIDLSHSSASSTGFGGSDSTSTTTVDSMHLGSCGANPGPSQSTFAASSIPTLDSSVLTMFGARKPAPVPTFDSSVLTMFGARKPAPVPAFDSSVLTMFGARKSAPVSAQLQYGDTYIQPKYVSLPDPNSAVVDNGSIYNTTQAHGLNQSQPSADPTIDSKFFNKFSASSFSQPSSHPKTSLPLTGSGGMDLQNGMKLPTGYDDESHIEAVLQGLKITDSSDGKAQKDHEEFPEEEFTDDGFLDEEFPDDEF